MALRVLLADESSTIKKVFQLALQDFAVDVRPVNVGIDVLTVAQNFKPDIIFADVLLQKKSGYEVAAELKQNQHLGEIPVVLMWSGFMELDEDKFQASHANAQLEKPFDVTALRKLVTELVPRTQSQRLSQFLAFPKLPEFEEKASAPTAAAPAAASAKPASEEDFQTVPIPKMKGGAGADKHRLNLKPEELDNEHVPVAYGVNTETSAEAAPFIGSQEEDEVEMFTMRGPPKSPSVSRTAAPTPPPPPQEASAIELPPIPEIDEIDLGRSETSMPGIALNEQQLEKIIRAQAAEVIESVVWKIVPDLATQIIERELNRLLKERDTQPY